MRGVAAATVAITTATAAVVVSARVPAASESVAPGAIIVAGTTVVTAGIGEQIVECVYELVAEITTAIRISSVMATGVLTATGIAHIITS